MCGSDHMWRRKEREPYAEYILPCLAEGHYEEYEERHSTHQFETRNPLVVIIMIIERRSAFDDAVFRRRY